MLADRVLAVGEVDAERLVARHVAVLTLDVGSDLIQRLVRRARRAAKLGQRHLPDAGYAALDDVTLHLFHGLLLLTDFDAASLRPLRGNPKPEFLSLAKARLSLFS